MILNIDMNYYNFRFDINDICYRYRMFYLAWVNWIIWYTREYILHNTMVVGGFPSLWVQNFSGRGGMDNMIHLHNIYVCNDISNSSHQLVFQGKSLILSQMKATFTLYCDRRRHFWEGYHDGEAGNCPRGCRSPPTGPLLLSSLTSRSTYCLSIILCPPTEPLL